jgi:hypothetical protein
MNTCLWLLLFTAQPSDVEWVRDTSVRLPELSAQFSLLSSREMVVAAELRTRLAVDHGTTPNEAVGLNAELAIAPTPALSLRLGLPAALWSPGDSAGLGNLSVGALGRLSDGPLHQLGVLVELRFPTGQPQAQRSVRFGDDLSLYARGNTTVSVGGLLESRAGPVALGGALGVDAIHHRDRGAPNRLMAASWGGAHLALPLAFPAAADWSAGVAPTVELNWRSTWSEPGVAHELTGTAGLTVSALGRRPRVEDDVFRRVAVAVGYQRLLAEGGLSAQGDGGRLIVLVTMGDTRAASAFVPAAEQQL